VSKNIFDESVELLTYLETRDLSEKEACAVMGIALQSLFADPTEARMFIRVLASQLHVSDELKVIQ
jgi:hypothetical protein